MTHAFCFHRRLLIDQADVSQALIFLNGLLCASITYRRELPQKVTIFFKIFRKFQKNHLFPKRRRPVLAKAGLSFAAATFYLADDSLTRSANCKTPS